MSSGNVKLIKKNHSLCTAFILWLIICILSVTHSGVATKYGKITLTCRLMDLFGMVLATNILVVGIKRKIRWLVIPWLVFMTYTICCSQMVGFADVLNGIKYSSKFEILSFLAVIPNFLGLVGKTAALVKIVRYFYRMKPSVK